MLETFRSRGIFDAVAPSVETLGTIAVTIDGEKEACVAIDRAQQELTVTWKADVSAGRPAALLFRVAGGHVAVDAQATLVRASDGYATLSVAKEDFEDLMLGLETEVRGHPQRRPEAEVSPCA
jgi:hypothetical protein